MSAKTSSQVLCNRDSIIHELEEIAPHELAEPFDSGRIGLIFEGREEVVNVHTALDATPKVIEEAISQGSDLLITHHTPIWNPLTSISGSNVNLFRKILEHQLNVYVMHTNWDHAPGGVNDILGSMLGLIDIERMSLGVIGTCSLTPVQIQQVIGGLLRVWGSVKSIKRLAIVGGSGFDIDLIYEAVSLGADTFLSAELRHSVYRSSPIPLLESTHYALEAPAMRVLAERKGWCYIDDPPVITSFL